MIWMDVSGLVAGSVIIKESDLFVDCEVLSCFQANKKRCAP